MGYLDGELNEKLGRDLNTLGIDLGEQSVCLLVCFRATVYNNTFQHLENHQWVSRNRMDDKLDIELDMLCERKAKCILLINLAQKNYKICKQ